MDYEFDEQQNKSIAGVVQAARAASIALFALAALKTVPIFTKGETGNVVYTIFTTLLAVWLWRVGSAFDNIVKTEGDDTIHLISGFQQLQRTMGGIRTAQILMLVVLLIFLVIAVLAVLSKLSH